MDLYHHGIKGQKWGVRRFQNRDGTWTPEGKERRNAGNDRDREFELAEGSVIQRLSNNYEKFNKQPIDIPTVKARGRLNNTESVECVSLAAKKFTEASKLEPQITKDIVSAVSDSKCKMYGLEFRLKQPTSLAAKIGADSKEKNISFEDASKGIRDAIRYTPVSDTKNFVNNYSSIKKSLEDKGYSETRCKNFFEKYKRGEVMHKAVQCTYKNKNGYEFELQFQTPASQAAKELKIPIYEERRKAGISEKRALELEARMRDLAESVEDPPYIERIK